MANRMQQDPDGSRLPIKLDSTSNGEFMPIPLDAIHHHANRLALENADRNARRRGVDRRSFLVSACGAASTLLAFNSAYATRGERGGYFELDPEAAMDPQLAAAGVEGKEFIFDVQGHFVNPTAPGRKNCRKTPAPCPACPMPVAKRVKVRVALTWTVSTLSSSCRMCSWIPTPT